MGGLQFVLAAPEGKILTITAQKNALIITTGGAEIKTKSFVLDSNLKDTKRFVVDFENANLTTHFIFDSDNLEPCSARISQFSTKPLITRLVITGPQEQINSLKITKKPNQIQIGFTEAKSINPLKLPQPLNINLIQNINWINAEEGLKIIASKPISVSKTKISEKKVVFDLINTSLVKNDLSRTIKPSETKTSEEIRIAQFQPKTVRVVIDGVAASSWQYKNTDNNLIILKNSQTNKNENTDQKPVAEENKEINKTSLIKIIGDNPVQIQVSSLNEQNIKYKTFRLHSPERLVLDLYNWDVENVKSLIPSQYPKSLIINIRASRLSNTSKLIRIVFDLAQKGVSIDDKLADNKQKLTLTLNPLLSESMQASLKELRKVRTDLKIVIDAGHGGYDAGAIYSGVEEKNLTLSMTKQLKEILRNSKVDVVETRKDDQFISLDERVNITRKTQPDLFVSVHCNALQSSSDIKGIETYYFTPQSRALAHVLQKKLLQYTKAPDRQVRKARFVVIRETTIPSVLLETGFLSSPSERSKLLDKDYQALIVKAIAEGILEYLSDTKTSQTATLSPK